MPTEGAEREPNDSAIRALAIPEHPCCQPEAQVVSSSDPGKVPW
jgi:hypothetical protein